MRSRKILTLFFVIIVVAGKLPAQVYAPAASDSFGAAYNPSGGSDKVFVFNRPAYHQEVFASIRAASIDRLSGWSFQWAVFNPVTKTYVNVSGPGNGISSTIDTITVSSGYQVTMIKETTVHVYRVWILINDLGMNITNKDSDHKLLFGYYNCSSLDLRADTTLVPLFYYNPVTKAAIRVLNTYTVRWVTNNEEASTPSNRLITRVNNPPSEDTWYVLTLTDNFGLERSDSVFYESIQSKAVITAEYVNLSDTVEYAGRNYGDYYDDGIKSAPGRYRFDLSGSRNMASFEIDFGDGEKVVSEGDSLESVHEFKLPGNYVVVLTTKSAKPYECLDSVSVAAVLVYADAGNFDLPNVFTPNGDGHNDRFRCTDISVRNIDIAIFDRAGLKVHTYAGNIRDWEGWDGKVKNSNRDAPEGVYYYVVSMLNAYEATSNPIGSKVMKGYFHLYR